MTLWLDSPRLGLWTTTVTVSSPRMALFTLGKLSSPRMALFTAQAFMSSPRMALFVIQSDPGNAAIANAIFNPT